MNEDLLYYITNHAGSLSVQELLINFFSALVIGFIIFLSYRFSHSGAVYNGRFNVSLWMLTIVTTMVMCVIGNNVALSLGMVGALSIVRFRTAIKDARDAAYIFWCIAVGICCGISDFVTASIGSVTIFLLMLAIGGVGLSEEVETSSQEPLKGKARLCVKNQGRDMVEYIYELSEKQVQVWQNEKLSRKLLELEKVTEVNLVGQNDEISS